MVNSSSQYPSKLFQRGLTRLLIVEGKEDELFVRSMLNYMRISSIDVHPLNGKDNIGNRLNAIVSTPGFSTVEVIGIMLDADNAAKSTFQKVRDNLNNVKLSVPKRELEISGSNPGVITLILPGNNRTGMLETLCLDSVREHESMPCIDDYFDCLNQQIPIERNLAKAKLHVYLASAKEPGKRLGEATWDWGHSAFSPIRTLLELIAKA